MPTPAQTATDLATYVRRTIDSAPRLSERQRDRIALVLRDPATGRRMA